MSTKEFITTVESCSDNEKFQEDLLEVTKRCKEVMFSTVPKKDRHLLNFSRVQFALSEDGFQTLFYINESALNRSPFKGKDAYKDWIEPYVDQEIINIITAYLDKWLKEWIANHNAQVIETM